MYKLIGWLCQPYSLVLLAMAIALALAWRRESGARRFLRWVALCWLLLVIVSLPAVAHLATKGLEYPYPPIIDVAAPGAEDAIIVLTGGVSSPDSLRPYPELNESSLYRCLRAAELYKQGGGCEILISGGKVDRNAPGAVSSHVMREFLKQLGVAADDLKVEDQSRTTYESAAACKELFGGRAKGKLFLVTDATHLRRAVACFRLQGMAVIPVGCHYRATKFEWKLSAFLPSASALGKLHTDMHEWLGLAWYWLRGRI